jgi:hypothetical protein
MREFVTTEPEDEVRKLAQKHCDPHGETVEEVSWDEGAVGYGVTIKRRDGRYRYEVWTRLPPGSGHEWSVMAMGGE